MNIFKLKKTETFIEKEKKESNIIIVIARYNEKLEWTLEEPFNKFKYIVYNKGNNENFEKKYVKEIIKLPNVGKCDHTYLYYIINNYNDLSDITIFLPGSLDMIYKKRLALNLLNEINNRNNAVFISLNEVDVKNKYYSFKMDKYDTKYKGNKTNESLIELKKSNIRPFGLWFDNMFGNIKVNNVIYYGIFSIHKEDIIQHPITRYEKLIKELSDHANPEAGHYFERSWGAVFYPLKKTLIVKYNEI